ncbi:hypothetical protein [Candidatus Nitrosacidococcus sp. I8]|uniref:hypothetical protein n=1 Tax=Candidatus Nitrosacidococcus sp. I8 TaxID=2942908 RepID=UPI002226F337|nr:hypothetical protein [Candidatus Nitrosacidococcus sp. I8]CAH9018515.1 hypothetical protein NURINAE_00969 [Candidatus Nitrosacidococcus sp. I8]
MMKRHIPFIIAYDFDSTLTSGKLKKGKLLEQSADRILAYMNLMLQKASATSISIRKEKFIEIRKRH